MSQFVHISAENLFKYIFKTFSLNISFVKNSSTFSTARHFVTLKSFEFTSGHNLAETSFFDIDSLKETRH